MQRTPFFLTVLLSSIVDILINVTCLFVPFWNYIVVLEYHTVRYGPIIVIDCSQNICKTTVQYEPVMATLIIATIVLNLIRPCVAAFTRKIDIAFNAFMICINIALVTFFLVTTLMSAHINIPNWAFYLYTMSPLLTIFMMYYNAGILYQIVKKRRHDPVDISVSDTPAAIHYVFSSNNVNSIGSV